MLLLGPLLGGVLLYEGPRPVGIVYYNYSCMNVLVTIVSAKSLDLETVCLPLE